MICTRCEKMGVRKFAYSSTHFDYKAIPHQVNLCYQCAFIILNTLFDHIEGDAYNNLIHNVGKPIHAKEGKNASSLSQDEKSHAKRVWPEKRRKNSSSNMEQKKQRNRKHSRKRKKVVHHLNFSGRMQKGKK